MGVSTVSVQKQWLTANVTEDTGWGRTFPPMPNGYRGFPLCVRGHKSLISSAVPA